MNYLHVLFFGLCLLITTACHKPTTATTKQPLASSNAPIVILISWDGVRYDYPDLDNYPSLQRMARDGIRATKLIPVYPADTFPAHVSIATGTYPDRHGIVNNQFMDRRQGRYSYSADANWLLAEPLWIAAERQGIKAATYFWVGSETAWHGQRASYSITPFDNSHSATQKVDKILEWLSLPETERPQLIMSYWRGTDHSGHTKGPDHPDIRTDLKQQDEQLTRLMAAIDIMNLWPITTLMLVSDHGMTQIKEFVALGDILETVGIKATILGGASLQHLFFDNTSDRDRAKKALSSKSELRVILPTDADADERYIHPQRSGDLIVTVEPPLAFGKISPAKQKMHELMAKLKGWNYGGHGYNPHIYEHMHGIFFAYGRNIQPQQTLKSVHQIDVAATVTTLLGITPPLHSEGRSIFRQAVE